MVESVGLKGFIGCPVRVKICCITSQAETALAVRCGADALGFVSEMPTGPGTVSTGEIAPLSRLVPPTIARFLLTSRTTVAGIVDQQRETRCDVIQLCSRIEDGSIADLRRQLPGVRLIPVVHVTGPEVVELAIDLSVDADAILLDTGQPSGPNPVLGGTGKTHDWGVSRKIRESVDKPVFLAGGLNSTNVQEALRLVEPFGVDVCSGVRTNGKLDELKLREFLGAVRSFRWDSPSPL